MGWVFKTGYSKGSKEWNSLKDLLNHKAGTGYSVRDALNYFLNLPEVPKLLNNNNWESLINIWKNEISDPKLHRLGSWRTWIFIELMHRMDFKPEMYLPKDFNVFEYDLDYFLTWKEGESNE